MIIIRFLLIYNTKYDIIKKGFFLYYEYECLQVSDGRFILKFNIINVS